MPKWYGSAALLVSMFMVTTAQAESYRVAGTTKESVAYLNADRLVVEGSQRSAWLTIIQSNLVPMNGRDVAYRLERWDVDCRRARYQRAAIHFYSEDGDVLYTHSDASGWTDAVPMSFADEIVQAVCRPATADNPPQEVDLLTLLTAARATLRNSDR